MLVSLNSQAYIFLCTVLGGIIVGFTYDLFRISRKVIKTNNYIVYLEDILFWLLVSIIIFAVLFISNAGEIRGYAILGIILGIIIYACLISHYIMKFTLAIITVGQKIIKFSYKKLKGPVKFIAKTIGIPFFWMHKLLQKLRKIINKVKTFIGSRLKLNIKNIKITLKKF